MRIWLMMFLSMFAIFQSNAKLTKYLHVIFNIYFTSIHLNLLNFMTNCIKTLFTDQGLNPGRTYSFEIHIFVFILSYFIHYSWSVKILLVLFVLDRFQLEWWAIRFDRYSSLGIRVLIQYCFGVEAGFSVTQGDWIEKGSIYFWTFDILQLTASYLIYSL